MIGSPPERQYFNHRQRSISRQTFPIFANILHNRPSGAEGCSKANNRPSANTWPPNLRRRRPAKIGLALRVARVRKAPAFTFSGEQIYPHCSAADNGGVKRIRISDRGASPNLPNGGCRPLRAYRNRLHPRRLIEFGNVRSSFPPSG